MKHKTKRACQVCGKPFYGSKDLHYCPECARLKKLDTVVRIRTCQDCGIDFYGGPRARRCPDCAYIAKLEDKRKYQSKGAKRPIGSNDKCVICGSEYTVVSGRQKYCSDACQRIGVLEWQREHKKGYDKKSGQDIKKQKRRDVQQKICVYCLKPFVSDTATNICSDYCRSEQAKLIQCMSDIKRGQNRDLKKYEERREEYRKNRKLTIEEKINIIKHAPEIEFEYMPIKTMEIAELIRCGYMPAEITKMQSCTKQNVHEAINRAVKIILDDPEKKKIKEPKSKIAGNKKASINYAIYKDRDMSILAECEKKVLLYKIENPKRSNKDIAKDTGLTAGTVGVYLTHARQKLDGTYIDNPDKMQEYRKNYYAKNKDYFRKHKTEYYKNNRERIREKEKEWRSKNKEKIRDYNKKYNQKNIKEKGN